MSLLGKVSWQTLLGELSGQAEQVEVVVVAEQGLSDDWIEGVDDVFPNCLSTETLLLCGLETAFELLALHVVCYDHVSLVGRYTSGLPCEPFGSNNGPVKWLGEEDLSDAWPESTLFL